MRATIAIAILVPTLAMAEPATSTVGYIGCSNTYMTWQGIGPAPGYWPTYYTGGASIDQWANPAMSFWASYDSQVAKYGQPDVVWVEVCENEGRPVGTSQILQALANLAVHSPGATVYLSPINDYDPVALCSVLGPDGNLDIKALVDEVVGMGAALRGPDTGPLNFGSTDPLRHCHPNLAARKTMAQQLVGALA